MLVLFSCILLNSLIGVVFKLFEKFGVDNFQAIVVNYLVCVLTATVVSNENPIPANLFQQPWIGFALGLGVLFIIVFNLFALTVQKTGIMVSTIFQKMSLVAPSLIAILIFHETSDVGKWAGIAISLVAIVLLSYSSDKENKSTIDTHHVWIYPFLTFIGSCIIDSSIYLVQKNNLVQEGDIGFVASLFLFAGLTGLVILIIRIVKGQTAIRTKNIIAGVCLGIPNFFSIYLLLLALQQGWEGSVVFPINNVGVLVLAAFFGIVLFKEKLNGFKLAGFILSLLAIFFITYSS
jgi:drug/metabolite transporter (DMT)-like permease